jgi:prolyl-tRNA synthetase
MKGVPLRLTIGARDLANNVIEVARRDTKEKTSADLNTIIKTVTDLLTEIQNNIYNRAKAYRDAHITKVDNWDEFIDVLDNKTGFVSAHWDGTPETEEKIKELSKATIRCIPFDAVEEAGKCVLTGKPSNKRVLFARAY